MSSAATSTTTTTSPTKTYRYAPKSVIANTYMRKLGTNALEQYRKNMSALYSSPDQQPPAQPTATVHPIAHDANGTASSPYNIDPERARLAYHTRPNAPRPLRRRLSSGEVPQVGDFMRGNSSQAPGLAPVRSPSFEDDAFVRHETNNNVHKDSEPKEGEPPTSPSRTNVTSLLQKKKGNLKKQTSLRNNSRRVTFDPLALLLDASLEGELDLVMRSAELVSYLDSRAACRHLGVSAQLLCMCST
jgi:apoptosis-stimulating of p53 protein 1